MGELADNAIHLVAFGGYIYRQPPKHKPDTGRVLSMEEAKHFDVYKGFKGAFSMFDPWLFGQGSNTEKSYRPTRSLLKFGILNTKSNVLPVQHFRYRLPQSIVRSPGSDLTRLINRRVTSLAPVAWIELILIRNVRCITKGKKIIVHFYR